ncbi:MAG: hypothetical protein M3R63_19970 [Actinomycetota bacterium]|nr:hypothetical protein [Actinomycetota bacterium]
MAVQTHTCVTIRCDGCGSGPHDGDGEGEVHYPSAAVAAADLTGDRDPERCWSVEGARHLCPDCLCVRDGHLWQAPRRCLCVGRIRLAGHSQDCRVVARTCTRCLRGQDVDPS